MNEANKTKAAKVIAYARFFARFIPLILQLVLIIGFIPLLMSLTPYIDGSEELETAMTPSQLTAIFLVLIIVYGIMMIGNMGKRS